jgi:hypothetical protein
MQGRSAVDGPTQRPELLEKAVAIWRKAQILYEFASWEGEPRARAIAEQIAESHPEYEADLAALLLDPSQLVAAYALWTLERMRSPLLENISPEVLQRRSRVSLSSGSIQTDTNLGALARQAQRRARQRAGLPPTPPLPRDPKEIGVAAD